MLLPDHLVLLEFKLTVRYEKLIGQVFLLLVEVVDLRRLFVESSQHILRLHDGANALSLRGSELLVGVSIGSCSISALAIRLVARRRLIYLDRSCRCNIADLVNWDKPSLMVPDHLGYRCLVFVNDWSI